MGEIPCGSQAELRCSIVERLAAAQKPLSRRLVGEAAAACGVAESTMWRWIAEWQTSVAAAARRRPDWVKATYRGILAAYALSGVLSAGRWTHLAEDQLASGGVSCAHGRARFAL